MFKIKNKAKTTHINTFPAEKARHNETIISEYSRLCQILDVAAAADWWSDVQRRPLIYKSK